ncbi:diguanylate cyclase [Dokdonella sp. MW10]|uniref:sensor domain-containing diguanylate cyclase n=1 Tax=Dokdonella sp. MW10 TaxID=2992926 RepID=UPI003F80BFAC
MRPSGVPDETVTEAVYPRADPTRVPSERDHAELARLPRRVYRLRMLGMGLAGVAIASVLHELSAPVWQWVLLFGTAIAWSQIAYLVAARSRDPYTAECRNLLVDSALAGLWIPLMHFNLLPSLLLATLSTVDKIAVGIPRLWLWSSLGMFIACVVAGVLTGFAWQPFTSMPVIVACMPMLVVHTIAVSLVSYRLVRKVRRQNRMLDELSRTDGLTGLAARRAWQDHAAQVLQQRHAGAAAASLLMLDIDGFKTINDSRGHALGDEVIRAVATVIRDRIGNAADAGRYGGDEFGIVLPGVRYRQAVQLAERLRADVEDAVLPGAAELRVTISIGVAEAVDGHAGLRDWIEAADSALYRAKSAGRNRVAGPVVMPIDAMHPVPRPRA